MSFDIRKCFIESIYCGNKKTKFPFEKGRIKYTSKGTPYSCLQKGYGSAKYNIEKKGLKKDSLKNIPYIGDVFEKNFIKYNIKNIGDLIKFSKKATKPQLRDTFNRIFKKSDGIVHKNAFNSTLIFLFEKGILKNLPQCKKI